MYRAWLVIAVLAAGASGAAADGVKTPPVFRFENQDRRLSVEVLDDDLFHFEYRADGETQDGAIPTSPMVFKTDYTGPKSLKRDGNRIETNDLAVTVRSTGLGLEFQVCSDGVFADIIKIWIDGGRGAEARAAGGAAFLKGTIFDGYGQRFKRIYGLGEQLLKNDQASLDWRGMKRSPGNTFGNHLVEFLGGAVGNAQLPIMYAMGGRIAPYEYDGKDEADLAKLKSRNAPDIAIFVDTTEALNWDLDENVFSAVSRNRVFRWYVLVGSDLADVRRDFMELVGRPPVPPRAAFGLWVSEYGYDDWAELDDKLKTLRAAHFPIEGFVLDLQWFGGIGHDGEGSRMGAIDWDRKAFPDPAKKIAELREREGIGLITIEEPYVSTGLADFAALEKDSVLVKAKENGPAAVMKSWWGKGGMVDFTSESAANEWHDRRRKPLIDAGIAGHWTDLGEPENYPDVAWYHGFGAGHDEAANHNLYNFGWAASIARGYERQGSNRRPFILTRSGTAGVQRFGAAMWSGDIAANMPSLRAHFRAQAHMSLSGVDYFGSDIGGFHRGKLDGDLNDLYTRWFANSCLTDVPVRPHTSNTENKTQTAPDRIGDTASNLANIRRRYELIPYIYSLAHEANRTGEPVFPPLVYHFESDATAQTLCDHKMIGPSLLAAMIGDYKINKRDVYLPKGVWFDFEGDARCDSGGQWFKDVPIVRRLRVMAPLFARAGAIIPLMPVDDDTMNAAGRRLDGSRDERLKVRIYPSEAGSAFSLYEDDGETIACRSGAVRVTEIRQKMTSSDITIDVDAGKGDYPGAAKQRRWVFEIVILAEVGAVELDGAPAEISVAAREGADAKAPGSPATRLTLRPPPLDAAKAHRITLRLGGKP